MLCFLAVHQAIDLSAIQWHNCCYLVVRCTGSSNLLGHRCLLSAGFNTQHLVQPQAAVFLDKNTKVVCQGMTGKNGTFHTEQARFKA